MENGGLGEAKAKAFLLERFWVLERSVDIQGADYLIQRKLTSQNFLDQSPPRLGVVQVKYIQDSGTTISLNLEYVVDDNGNPYGEFFLLVFSGREDSEVSFLFSGKEIADKFKKTEKDGKRLFRESGSAILSMTNHKIVSRKLALDKIEHALKNSDFRRNRHFLSLTNHITISEDHIDHDLLLPLDNGYCDIREEFFKYKTNAQRVLLDMEEVVDAINKILRATDPVQAYDIYEQEIEQYVDWGGWGRTISFRADNFIEEDFVSAVMNHKKRLEKIRKLGVESAYFKLINTYESEVLSYVTDNLDIIGNGALEITVTYKNNLCNPNIVIKQVSLENKVYPVLGASKLGCQQIIENPLDWLSWEVRAGKASIEDIDVHGELNKQSWVFRRPFHRQLDELLLGEELAAPSIDT